MIPKLFPIQKGFWDLVKYCDNKMDAVRQAEALLVVTEWDEYKNMNVFEVCHAMRFPVIIDGRNIYNPIGSWITYMGIGNHRKLEAD